MCNASRNETYTYTLEKDIQYFLRQGGGLVEEPCQLIRLRGFSTHNSEGSGVFAQVQIVLLPGAMLHRDSIWQWREAKRSRSKEKWLKDTEHVNSVLKYQSGLTLS